MTRAGVRGTVDRIATLYLPLAAALLFLLAPFYWMLITSLKSNSDLYNVTNIPFWFNEAPTLEHFEYLFQQTLFTRDRAMVGAHQWRPARLFLFCFPELVQSLRQPLGQTATVHEDQRRAIDFDQV